MKGEAGGSGPSRRHLLTGAAALFAGGALGGTTVETLHDESPRSGMKAAHGTTPRRIDFHGRHQAGIATPVQAHLHFAAYDVLTTDRTALAALLREWTLAAREMTANRQVGGGALGDRLAPPADTGEAVGLDAANLTLTLGLGPSVFDERFGLVDERPAALVDLPAFPGERLDPDRCGGDLALQACSDDQQVAAHAVRNLTRMAAGRAAVRWTQLGFCQSSTSATDRPTARNLLGFKDGTSNVGSDDETALDEHVWATAADGPRWMAGGCYLVARRIRMTIETWDRTSLAEQEAVIGRSKMVGAPLGRTHERDAVRPGELPSSAHVRLAHPSLHHGARLLRRGFNFIDGVDELGHLDAGLFFMAFQRDPRTQFVPIQHALARHDAMNAYIRHTGSSLWAVPPGVGPRGWWGQTLLG